MDWKRTVRFAGGYPFAVAAVLASTGLLLLARPHLRPESIMLLMVPVVAAIARLSVVRVSAVAALVAFIALDVLFVPPYYRLRVASPREWIGLVTFLVVALLMGRQTSTMRAREQAALTRQLELELLNRLSFEIASEQSPRLTAVLIVEQVSTIVGAERVALYVTDGEGGAPECRASKGAPEPSEEAFVDWVVRNNKAVGLPDAPGLPAQARPATVSAAEALPATQGTGMYVPLQTATTVEGVLCVRAPVDAGAPGESARFMVSVANIAAASLERQRLEGDAARARALQEADRLRSTFVSSVSHELKTPLAAATARVTGLLEEGADCTATRVREELRAVAEDLGRLDASIGDLLDISRLQSDAWRPKLETQDIGDILGTVLSRLPAAQRPRVRFDLAQDLPAIRADFSQLTRALLNLVENALSYSPPDEPVAVTVRAADGGLEVCVEDRGPGVPDEEKDSVFEKSYRGTCAAGVPAGTGLGLTITAEIVRTHGGRVWVEDARPHGARFVVALPEDAEQADAEEAGS